MLEHAIENTDVLKRRFRHCAGRALMILRNYKGNQKSAGRQQISAQILYSAVKQLDPNFPVLKEARREVLEDLMDVKHAQLVIEAINKGLIKVAEIDTSLPSPFALNIIARGYSDILKLEDKLEFVRRMHNEILLKISMKEKIAEVKA